VVGDHSQIWNPQQRSPPFGRRSVGVTDEAAVGLSDRSDQLLGIPQIRDKGLYDMSVGSISGQVSISRNAKAPLPSGSR